MLFDRLVSRYYEKNNRYGFYMQIFFENFVP